MEKGIVFDQMPEFVVDLGTGFSNVQLNISEFESTDEDGNAVTKYMADVFRVINPATYENVLRQVKEQKVAQIKAYDKSGEVNSFTIAGVQMWMDKDTRVGLKLRFDAEKSAGIINTTLWSESGNFSGPIVQAEAILTQVELYASVCYDKTANHVIIVMSLTDANHVANYDFKSGYPEKLSF